jgi:hypothetical protein
MPPSTCCWPSDYFNTPMSYLHNQLTNVCRWPPSPTSYWLLPVVHVLLALSLAQRRSRRGSLVGRRGSFQNIQGSLVHIWGSFVGIHVLVLLVRVVVVV